MPYFRLRARARPDEVSIAIGGNGTTATVFPPEHARTDHPVRDMSLANALHFAGALADQFDTDVGVIDDTESVFFIDEPEPGLILKSA